MAKPFTLPPYVAIDGNGNPMAGALLNFYITGTTTQKNTYSDSALTIVNSNPVIADGNGLFGPIYLAQDVDYKIVLTTSAGVVVATRDPLLVINTSVISHQGSMIIGNAAGADSELLISATNGATLRSTGTTAAWRTGNYTIQKFLSGSGTYTLPANATALRIRICAGGGGGGGTGGTTGPAGTVGATSSFAGITAIGGGGGTGNTSGTATTTGGAGGTGGAGTAFRIPGGAGGYGGTGGIARANGGGSGAGGAGAPFTFLAAAGAGLTASANTGGGGSGSSSVGTTESASAGGGGEFAEIAILTPSATYAYVVGGGGAGGIGTGTGAATGGAGGSGFVYVEEFYY